MDVNECSFCFYKTKDYSKYEQHIVRFHKHDPAFMVYCPALSCEFSTSNLNTLKSHRQRQHKGSTDRLFLIHTKSEDLDQQTENNLPDSSDDEGFQYAKEMFDLTETEQYRLLDTKFALKLETASKLTRKSTDTVLLDTQDRYQHHAIRCKFLELHSVKLFQIYNFILMNELKLNKY